MIATLRDVGLAARPNVSFARGLKTLVRFGAEKYAVIDVGTNSVKFHIGERGTDGDWHKVPTAPSRRDSATGSRRPAGSTRNPWSGQRRPSSAWRRKPVGNVSPTSQRSARPACGRLPNGAGLRGDRAGACGVDLEIISGEDEARLAYLGARGRHRTGSRVPRRVRHGWGQLAVHVRTRRPGRGAVQRPRGRRPVHRAVRARRAGLRAGADRGTRRHRRRPGSPRRPARTRRTAWPWAGR